MGILTVLLQNEKVTAPYLAERFEVSRRTINRDIEDICKAGIPIITMQGVNGGISIAEGYKIDKTLFKPEELSAIFIGLQSLNSVSQTNQYTQIIDKFVGNSEGIYSGSNHLLIDLASHYKSTLSVKIGEIRSAIKGKRLIQFDYFYHRGEVHKIIEPYLIIFKWSSWYVYGYCREKKDFRLFKLNRLWHLKTIDEGFEHREIPQQDTRLDSYFKENILLVALFNEGVKYRLIEEYGIESFQVVEDNRLLFKTYFTSQENLLQWILSFGDQVEVLEPKQLQVELKSQAERILQMYLNHDR